MDSDRETHRGYARTQVVDTTDRSGMDFGNVQAQPIADEGEIGRLFGRLISSGLTVHWKVGTIGKSGFAKLFECSNESLLIEAGPESPDHGDQLFVRFALFGTPHFFSAPVVAIDRRRLTLSRPGVVYRVERRERQRSNVETRVRLQFASGRSGSGAAFDRSPAGVGIRANLAAPPATGDRVRLDWIDAEPTRAQIGEVRNVASDTPVGWVRMGLELMPSSPPGLVETVTRAGGHRPLAAEVRDDMPSATEVDVVELKTPQGDTIAAIVDQVGGDPTAPTVVIPPAWGHTKETLLPLAAAILETFAEVAAPVRVIRFDGVRRRGESSNDPECRAQGKENRNFTFSQAVVDVEAVNRFATEDLGASCLVMVTFSAAAIEGRRAAARDATGRLAGWVSVVGAPDPQSLLRAVSGGIDFVAGYERGFRYGLRDIQGLDLDVDGAVADALEAKLAYVADARSDMAQIRVPVTWVHGRDDGWMSEDRVHDVMRFGSEFGRRIVRIPTGHQLRSSAQAADTFALVASEVGRMALSRTVEGFPPNRRWARARRKVERRRIRPAPRPDLRAFWQRYLLGRDGRYGFDLISATGDYQEFMEHQVDFLSLRGDELVLDLGSGTGTLSAALGTSGRVLPREIISIDYVKEALTRGSGQEADPGFTLRPIVADLSFAIPLSSHVADGAVASLLINYVYEPSLFLREVWRVLRPGGRLVLSSLRPDADVSKLCVHGIADLQQGGGRRSFGKRGEKAVPYSIEGFVSDAGALLDFEQRGFFRFWAGEELAQLVTEAGFDVSRVISSFGHPPQAILISAARR